MKRHSQRPYGSIGMLAIVGFVGFGLCLPSRSLASLGASSVRIPGHSARHQGKEVPATDELKALLATLRDSEVREREPERLAAAIDRVRQLRYKEAVPELVALISFRRPEPKTADDAARDDLRVMTDFLWYPAMGALAEIGVPAAEALSLAILEDEGRTMATSRALSVLFQIFRYRPADGVDFLNELAAKVRMPDTARLVTSKADDLRKLMTE